MHHVTTECFALRLQKEKEVETTWDKAQITYSVQNIPKKAERIACHNKQCNNELIIVIWFAFFLDDFSFF